jgi:hypothetical protein
MDKEMNIYDLGFRLVEVGPLHVSTIKCRIEERFTPVRWKGSVSDV